MKELMYYVGIRVNRNGKGLLGDDVMIEEYDHIYFGHDHPIEQAYKLIDKLLKAGKRERVEITLKEHCDHNYEVESVRRLYIELGYEYKHYGVANVGICDSTGCFDRTIPMDTNAVRNKVKELFDAVDYSQMQYESSLSETA